MPALLLALVIGIVPHERPMPIHFYNPDNPFPKAVRPDKRWQVEARVWDDGIKGYEIILNARSRDGAEMIWNSMYRPKLPKGARLLELSITETNK